MRQRPTVLCLALLCATGLGAAPTASSAPPKQLTVLAAASLQEFMDDAAPAFEKAHPGVKVRTSLAGSSELRIQIEQGAPADVFLSADTKNMDPLLAQHLVRKPVIFTKNSLAILVGRRYRATIKTPADLAEHGTTLVLAAPEVPVGNYSRRALAKMDASGKYGKDFSRRVLASVKSSEPNTKSVVAKVLLGEADAGLVYVTDATPEVRRSTRAIAIPDNMNVIATYPIAVVARSRNRALAQQFVDFVLSE